MRKINKILILFVTMFLIVGCSNGIKNEGNKIVIEKLVDGVDKYEPFNEVSNNKDIQSVNKILNSIKWEYKNVNMNQSSEYKFHFEDTNSKASGPIYELAIIHNRENIALVVASKGMYVQLDKDKSEKLIKLITGKNLSED